MKLVSVVGARPQFIKAAVLSRALRQHWDEVLVHTGQHYDDLMSDVFFRELGLPAPDTNLGVGSGSHAVQTARMLEGLEAVYEREHPDLVIVYGDTNSTLAGALAAAKLGLPVAHVEAGFRTHERDLPEEINRVLTDHVATHLFCATEAAADALRHEGITTNVHFTGDLMYDSLLAALPRAKVIEQDVLHHFGLTFADGSALEGEVSFGGEDASHPGGATGTSVAATDSPSPRSERGPGGEVSTGEASTDTRNADLLSAGGEEMAAARGGVAHPGGATGTSVAATNSPSPPAGRGPGGGVTPYYLATVHRAATTDDPAALGRVFSAFARLDAPVVLPLHPRTAAAMRAARLEAPANVRVIDPVGYFEMLALERNARAIITDSGGVRREAYWLAVPCVTLRAESEWPETVETGWDVLAGTEPDAIVRAAQRPRPRSSPPPLFGDGHAAEKIVEILSHDSSIRRR